MTDINEDLKDVVLNQIKLPKKVALLGTGMIKNNALLSQTLRAEVKRWYPWSSIINKDKPQAFIGWGHKKSFKRARNSAKKLKIPAYSVEDGFLRSIDSGIKSHHSVSMIIDDLGIYFDLTKTSRLEQMILFRANHQWTDAYLKHANLLITKICDNNLSKYNHTLYCPDLNFLSTSANSTSHVLLIDQVVGDASIAGAGANKAQFLKMFKDACKAHPNAQIWIKTHPASKKGYLSSLSLSKSQIKRVHFLPQLVNPIKLLRQVNQVYTVSSHMGFEALMLGKKVSCYGMSWYAGWGLTDDSGIPEKLLQQVQNRRELQKGTHLSTEQLFFAAYLDYSHYVDPASSNSCDINSVINWLITNRRMYEQFEKSELIIHHFSRWKVLFVKQFLQVANLDLSIKKKPRFKIFDNQRVKENVSLLVWGLAKKRYLQLQKSNLSIYCMEDGFVRSNGLGATLLEPLSVVIDKQGIYYDATNPSDLETYLQHCEQLNDEQSLRVQKLHTSLLNNKVSKYNVGNKIKSGKPNWLKNLVTSKKEKILIVGQVEDDLSIKNCAAKINKNADLINRVRKDNPDAFLLYKPHPDVEAGLRVGKVDKNTLKLVDAVAKDLAMPDCLNLIDTVHTISSLTGFEALLRSKKVVCYGLPFYAGWGLTIDADGQLDIQKKHLQRRARTNKLSLQQLIYCTLIQYPLYRLPNGYGLAQVEQVIEHLYNKVQAKNPHSRDLTDSSKILINLKFMQARNLYKKITNK